MDHPIPANKVDADQIINLNLFPFPVVTLLADQFSHVHRVRRVLHIQPMTEQPQLAMADEIIIDLRAGEDGGICLHIHSFIGNSVGNGRGRSLCRSTLLPVR